MRENGAALLLKDLITNFFLRILTGSPPKVSPKPVAPAVTVIVAPIGKFLKVSETKEEGAFPKKVIRLRLMQPEKAILPILVTLLGIVTLVKLLHPESALRPILTTPLGIFTLIKRLHNKNAPPPMVVTPAPIVTLVRLLQPE